MVRNLTSPFYKNSIHQIVVNILSKSKKPLSVTEITEKAKQHYSFSGKTPQKSVSAILQRSRYVKKISKGYYQIKNSK